MQMNVIDMPLSKLHPYENNPRLNDDAVPYVANSIKEFGFKVPIVVDRDGVIIAGHTRYKAAQQLGLETVPVIVANDLTDEQVKAFRLADNKVGEIATWDSDALEIELGELAEIEIDMGEFGFFQSSIDWDDVDEITPENFDEPGQKVVECPECGFTGKREQFIMKEVPADEALS